MTPSELATGQLWAAWVQAGGVVAGIFASILIAVSGDRRAMRAERAAEARAISAERAADRRIRQGAIDAHNALVRDALDLADQGIEILKKMAGEYRANTSRSTFVVNLRVAECVELADGFERLRIDASLDAETKRSIAGLRRVLQGKDRSSGTGSGPPQHWVQYFDRYVSTVDAARQRLALCPKTDID